MKNKILSTLFLFTIAIGFQNLNAQELQNFYAKNKEGINIFDVVKTDVPFNGLQLRIGGAFAL